MVRCLLNLALFNLHFCTQLTQSLLIIYINIKIDHILELHNKMYVVNLTQPFFIIKSKVYFIYQNEKYNIKNIKKW